MGMNIISLVFSHLSKRGWAHRRTLPVELCGLLIKPKTPHQVIYVAASNLIVLETTSKTFGTTVRTGSKHRLKATTPSHAERRRLDENFPRSDTETTIHICIEVVKFGIAGIDTYSNFFVLDTVVETIDQLLRSKQRLSLAHVSA